MPFFESGVSRYSIGASVVSVASIVCHEVYWQCASVEGPPSAIDELGGVSMLLGGLAICIAVAGVINGRRNVWDAVGVVLALTAAMNSAAVK